MKNAELACVLDNWLEGYTALTHRSTYKQMGKRVNIYLGISKGEDRVEGVSWRLRLHVATTWFKFTSTHHFAYPCGISSAMVTFKGTVFSNGADTTVVERCSNGPIPITI
jgi:hypothetical protein